MILTQDQERALLEKNTAKIYRAVDNFTARCTSPVARVPYEDFVQEVTIAFLRYIRKCETIEQAEVFPWFSAMGAMRDLVLLYQPLSCPKSGHRFREIIHAMPKTVSLDTISASPCLEVDGLSRQWVEDKETQIDFELFMNDQPETVQRVASMRVYGMSVKEISKQYGVTRTAIYKKLTRLYRQYKAR